MKTVNVILEGLQASRINEQINSNNSNTIIVESHRLNESVESVVNKIKKIYAHGVIKDYGKKNGHYVLIAKDDYAKNVALKLGREFKFVGEHSKDPVGDSTNYADFIGYKDGCNIRLSNIPGNTDNTKIEIW